MPGSGQQNYDNSKNEEKLGKAVIGIAYYFYAAKFILSVSLVALVILLIIGKPLWIAPIVGFVVFIIYRFIWRLFFRFVRWANKK